MAGFENDVVYALNADFTKSDNQAPSSSNGLATNGQLWIGSTAANAGGTHINVGTLTSPNGTLSFGYSSPNITVEVVSQNFAPIGALQYFAQGGTDTTYPGPQWLKTDGSILSQATYSTLFSRVGLINSGGTVWAVRTSPTTTTINAVAGGPSSYVFGAAGTANMGTSTDSITWTKIYPPTTTQLRSIIYAGGQFVGVGDGGVVVTSTDGILFDTRTPSLASGTGNNGNLLIYSGTKYVSGGATGQICTSTDGSVWTGRNSQTTSTILSILFASSLYVHAGVGGELATSTDAVTWTPRTSGTTSQIQSLTKGTVYVYGAAGGLVATSTDAITWSAQVSGTASPVWSLGFGNSVYVFGCTGGFLASSTDAVTWTSRTSQTTSTINTITYGTVYAYGAGGGRIASSTDATTEPVEQQVRFFLWPSQTVFTFMQG